MAHTKILTILILVFIIGCSIKKEYNIDDILNKFEELDKKYETSWRKEKLNLINIKYDNITLYLEDLNDLKIKQNKKNLVELIDARILMLEAQKEFLLAQNIDPRPLIEIKFDTVNGSLVNLLNLTGLFCENKENILKGIPHYQSSAEKSQKVILLFDKILEQSLEAQQKIGTGKNRIEFYDFPPGRIITSNKISKNIIINFCK